MYHRMRYCSAVFEALFQTGEPVVQVVNRDYNQVHSLLEGREAAFDAAESGVKVRRYKDEYNAIEEKRRTDGPRALHEGGGIFFLDRRRSDRKSVARDESNSMVMAA